MIRQTDDSLPDADARERELSQLLDNYLVSLEQGTPLDIEALADAHPELADDIRSFAESIQLLHDTSRRIASGSGSSPAVESTEQGTRRILGDFEIGAEIGRGGMGIVYEARQMSLERNVALKVLPMAAMWDEKQLARFQHEAQAAARLHHPHVVPVFAVGKERGVHYYAMQLIQGSSLDKIIKSMRDEELQQVLEPGTRTNCHSTRRATTKKTNIGTLHLQQSQFSSDRFTDRANYHRAVARLGVQAAEALHYAHECGVVHRDIKPSNLLLDHAGKLWIADFGVARCQDSPGVTVTGDVVGTLRYMSPEQATGRQALVDMRTDVYALGASLYELLTLKPAFPGDERHEVLQLVAEQDPPAPRKFDPSIPLDLETIILQSMSKNREDRYASAAHFAEDLKRFLEGKPTLARRPTLVDRSSKWVRRHRTLVAVAAVFLVALTLISGAAAILLSQEQTRTKLALAEAEENLEQARLVVDRFGNQFAEKLAQLPGSEPLRQRVLLDTLSYYQAFIERSAESPGLQEQLADTHFQVGMIASHLGQLSKAEQSYTKAIQLYETLDTASDSDDHRLRKATARNNYGVLLASQGKLEEARTSYRAALKSLPPFTQLTEANLPQLRLQAEIKTNLALLERQAGNLDAARTSVSSAIDLLVKAVEKFPASAQTRQSLALAYNNRTFLEQGHDLAAARASCEKALQLFEGLVSTPADPVMQSERRSDLALCYNNLAAIEGHQGKNEAAIETYQRALMLQQQLVRQYPHVIQNRCNLAITWNNLAQAWARGGDLEKSLDCQEHAQQLFAELVEDFPTDSRYRSSLAGVYNNRAMIALSTSQPKEAARFFELAIEHQSTAILQAPRHQQYREFLSKHYVNYAHSLVELGRHAQAAKVALKRRELWPENGEHLFQVATELSGIAERMKSADDGRQEILDDAVKTLKRAIAAGFDFKGFLHDKSVPSILRERFDFEVAQTRGKL